MTRNTKFNSSLAWPTAFWAFLLAIVLQLLVSIIWAIIEWPHGAHDAEPHLVPAQVALQIVLSSSVFALVAVGLAGKGGEKRRDNLAIRKPRWPVLFFGTIGALALGVITDEVTSLLFRLYPEQFDLALLERLGLLFHNASITEFIWLTAAITLGPAVGEELLFRGLILGAFTRSWKAIAGIVVSSVLFGMMHMDMLQGVGAGFIGLYLGYLVYRSGSIWPGVLAHAFNNLAVALTARIETTGLREILETGHSSPVVATGLVVLALSIFAIERSITKPVARPTPY